MAREIFVDTSGFYALIARREHHHLAAVQVVGKARNRGRLFVTTDYIVDETATLLKARRQSHLIPELFNRLASSTAFRIEWTDADRFGRTQTLFLKHDDQAWSFTDCLSFIVMRELQISEALTTDSHFEQAGFRKLLT